LYKQFYGLVRNPFDLSPDPFFFHPMPHHAEALAILTYGVLRRRGFVVITGEVGTGKTLLVRCLLDALNRDQIAFAFVYNPLLTVEDFLAHVLMDFGVPCTTRIKSEMLSRLNNYLVSRAQRGGITSLIVDEAQLLSWELLEEIRLMTNLETSQYKLLQIVLVGQPELDQKLDSHDLRQLKQRVGMRCTLQPLTSAELRSYIHHRLELAGAKSSRTVLFSDTAMDLIEQFSRGIPRLVNVICENSLILGFGRQASQITPDIILEVADDLHLIPTLLDNSNSTALEERKKTVRALFQVIENNSDTIDKQFNERTPQSEAKAE
jgi:general secretion pathway protein A